jgi:hypothetical protein
VIYAALSRSLVGPVRSVCMTALAVSGAGLRVSEAVGKPPSSVPGMEQAKMLIPHDRVKAVRWHRHGCFCGDGEAPAESGESMDLVMIPVGDAAKEAVGEPVEIGPAVPRRGVKEGRFDAEEAERVR